MPSYQSDFGLTPTTSDPAALVGRGMPDVSANAGGNMLLSACRGPTMDGPARTTAARARRRRCGRRSTSQFNAIFHDQGLPNLGYMNDLLYIAAAIAPGSFNDITLGNNTSSFALGGASRATVTPITPTGYGY